MINNSSARCAKELADTACHRPRVNNVEVVVEAMPALHCLWAKAGNAMDINQQRFDASFVNPVLLEIGVFTAYSEQHATVQFTIE